MKRNFILCVFAYAVITMAIAAPWHFVLFKDIYHQLGIYNRVEPNIPLGFLSMLVQGVVLAILYPGFVGGRPTLGTGIKFSLIMGLFLFSVSTLANAAKIQVSSMTTWLAVQAAFHLIQFLAVGLAIGLIYKKPEAAD
jgi:hypothetical protein